MNSQKTGFQGSETTLCDTIMMDTCHFAFVQTHRMHSKSEPWCKPWIGGNDDVSVWLHQV